MRALSCVVLAAILGLGGVASADHKFHPVPGGKAKLQLRIVSYDGAVNGQLTVEVKNRGAHAAAFTARGLYFVPDGDPDQAPQRLGAVGPMARGDDRVDEVRVPAGGKVTVTLDVYCVDDHREAPTEETPFTVARHRMPAALSKRIYAAAKSAADDAGGFGAAGAAEPVQSEVWKARDAKWMELDGEGAQEEAKAHHRDDDDARRYDEVLREPVRDDE